jgi:type III secretion protein D
MDQGVPIQDALRALELRVLEGPQAGARAPLAFGLGCVLAAEPEGKGEGADIVLRESQLPPARVRVTAELPSAMLEVLAGEVRLGDQVLGAGAQAPWPMYVPLQIGRSLVAFGRASVEDWNSVGASGAASPEQSADEATPAEAAKPLRRRAEVWLATMGAAVLVLCGAALWTAHLSAAPRPEGSVAAPTLAEQLAASEWAMLRATTHADGRVELRGRLATLEQRMRLDQWLAQRQVTAVVDVRVDEALKRDVADVFRVNGVTVQVQSQGPGHIAVEAAEPDAARLARAEEVVRRDVRGLEKLTVINPAKPLPPPAPPVPDDPGKRIASLVPGEPGYLVTADGARYFVGALLPTGHRITAIAKASVTLERDGQQATLNF